MKKPSYADYNREQLTAVIDWLQDRYRWLLSERMTQDMIALSNDEMDELQAEENAIKIALQTAREQRTEGYHAEIAAK
jgi:hypothetical protein